MIQDSTEIRLCPPSQPICPNKATVDRDTGDILSAEVAMTIGLFKGVILTPMYTFRYKFEDTYDGPQNFPLDVLEQDTDFENQQVEVVLNFTSIPWVVEGKFPVPFVVGFNWRDRFAGRNALKTQYVGFNLTLYGRGPKIDLFD